MTHQIPMLCEPVTLNSRFTEILGAQPDDMPEPERRHRWAAWLTLAREKNPSAARIWAHSSECNGCIHRRGGWCKKIGLPCTVNPYLTFKTGSVGMACMGLDYEKEQYDE